MILASCKLVSLFISFTEVNILFYARSTELERLNEMHESGKFEFAVIYGRRRIGKTTLIREFIKDKNAKFFAASESTAAVNLRALSHIINGKNTAVFNDYEAALATIFEMAENERVVFVIDEFPYLADAERSISSLLQILIDHRKDTSRLMLILCGSSMSFMENQVLGAKSPLYGRRTAQFKIMPFNFFESLPFYNTFEPTDKAMLYGITGGIPAYLTKIDPEKSVRENIIALYLTPSGNMFEEPSNLLKQELREPATYNAIIEAIASGASRLNEISTKCKLESNKCAKYLSSLISLGLVSKEYPYGEASTKRSIYKIEDNMFRFWYRFVFANTSAITAGLGEQVFTHEIETQLSAYMGLVFEAICKQWLFEVQKNANILPFFISKSGRWWGTNPETRTQEEIDIMATSGNTALFAECKWKNEIGVDVLHELHRKSKMFNYAVRHLYIFARNDFSEKLIRAEYEHFNLFNLNDMINAVSVR